MVLSDILSADLGFLTDTVVYGNTLWQYLLFSLTVIASFLVGKVVYYLLKNRVQKMAERTEMQFDDILVKILQGPLVLTIVIIGLMAGLGFLTLPEDMALFVSNVLSVLISLAIIWFAIRLSDAVIDAYMHPFTAKTETKLDEELLPILKKGVKALILIFGAITIIGNFGYDITAMITGLGIGGIAIALAAQETLGNMFGGITIFTDRPFGIGDRVKVGDVYGDVVDVGMRSSKIKNLDNNIVVIPNSVLSKSIVENYTRPSKKLKQSFTMGLTYDTKPDKIDEAVKIIKEAIQGVKGVTKDEPLIWFTEFGDFSLNLLCIYWIKSLKYWGTTKHEINTEILRGLNKAGIDIAFPSQTIYLEK